MNIVFKIYYKQSYERKLYKIQPKTLFVGKSFKYLPTCHSTNDYCVQLLANEDIVDGFCVHTGHQTKGRGQRNNVWESLPNMNILMSVFLKPDFVNANEQFNLNMAISLAIFKSISAIVPDNLFIKWPNDIYYKTNKIGGILIENTILGYNLTTSLVGIGLNINQVKFVNENALSLKNIINNDFDYNINEIIENILENLEFYYLKLKNHESEVLKNEYLSCLFRFNHWHCFKKNDVLFEGKIIGIDEFGRLQIETENCVETFAFKEVEFVI